MSSGFKNTVFALRSGQGKVVLRGLVPRIHVFVAGVKGGDGRVKSGQAGSSPAKTKADVAILHFLPAQSFPRTALRFRGHDE
jgi:hypothetical protein